MNSFSVKTAAILLILAIGITGVYLAQAILIPVMLASLVSILLNPVVDFLHYRWKISLFISVLLTLIGTMLVVATILLLLSRQVSSLSDDWPQIKEHFSQMYQQIQDWVHHSFHISYHKQQSYIQQATEKFWENGGKILEGTLGTFSSVLIKLVLALIYSLLILVYRNLFLTFLCKLIPPQHHTLLRGTVHQVKTVVSGYIVGLILEMAIVTLLLWIGLVILGVKYAFFLALFSAILNIIPYIGIWIGAIISMAFTLGTSADLAKLLVVLAIFAVTHLIDANILITKVVSSKVKINAFASIVGVLLGASLLGIWGTFLALPVLAVLKVILDRIPGLEPWGYLLGDEVPKNFRWQDFQPTSVTPD
jgi:predicted PurR-regulated permease PerM